MKKLCFSIILTAVLPVLAAEAALITRVEHFTGQYSEGFENVEHQVYTSSMPVFGGLATVESVKECECLVSTGSWVSYGIETVSHYNGRWMMGSREGAVRWVFETPAAGFGGYFASVNLIENTENATARFFDKDGLLVGSDEITALFGNEWTWNGWEFVVPVKSITITGYGAADWHRVGGLILHDDIQYTPVPEPATMLLLVFGAMGLAHRSRGRHAV